MKIALAQIRIFWENPEKNLARAETLIQQSARKGCDLIVFPEMFSTGFSMRPGLAEKACRQTELALTAAAKAYGINIIAGYALTGAGSSAPVNAAVVFDRSGSVIGRYAKMHPFTLAGEERIFRPGRSTVVFELEGLTASVFICYDLRFPEVFRAVAREADAIFVIANWPESRKAHWKTLLKARAIENQCYLIGVNRTGTDGNRIAYPGLSTIIGPEGSTVRAAGDRESLVVGTIDRAKVADVRGRYPFLRDMRL